MSQLTSILDVPPNHVLNFRETLVLLKQALAKAKAKPDAVLVQRLSITLARVNFDHFRLDDAHSYLNDALFIDSTEFKELRLNDASDSRTIHQLTIEPTKAVTIGAIGAKTLTVQLLINRAIVEYYQGNLDDTQKTINSALKLLDVGEQVPLQGCLLTMLGAVCCYLGEYNQAQETFAQARRVLTTVNDTLLLAWHDFVYAREYERDQDKFRQALDRLEIVLPVLKDQAGVMIIIENMLTLADIYIHIRELERAQEMIQHVETLIQREKSLWYRTELNIVKGSLAMVQGNLPQAEYCLRLALGTIGDDGDLRMLALVYRLLANIMEHDRERNADVRDALQRAITAGRVRSRQLHLTLALRHLGKHLRRPNYRPVARAKGGGYLFEADRMFIEMGMPRPPINEA